MSAALTVEMFTRLDRSVVLTVRGNIDCVTAHRLQQAVTAAVAARPPSLHLDLRFVPFIDASGIRVLVRARADQSSRR